MQYSKWALLDVTNYSKTACVCVCVCASVGFKDPTVLEHHLVAPPFGGPEG